MILLSPWGEQLNRSLPLNEYPRPQLVRDNWMNLNGMWECQITDGPEPSRHEGWKPICVPFALGSLLSGVEDQLKPGQVLWYRRNFTYHPAENHHQVLLNFEAVDQCCVVYLNGLVAGQHEGGYAPFSVDITNLVKVENEMLVRVTDDSDQGIYVYGKQRLNHGGMWYTPSSGIWQTVWIEELPEHSMQDVKITPDPENGMVYLQMAGTFTQAVITVFADRKLIHRGMTSEMSYSIALADVHAWTPEDPFLYDLYIQTEDETVRCYFGMRRFSRGRDSSGRMRFQLNGKPVFLSGLLDQGYSCDGLMTYPSDEAMIFDIEKARDLGFNFLRKHVKIESRRWYYHCDRLGMLVMQDMPNGGGPYDSSRVAVWPTLGRRNFPDTEYEKNGRADERGRREWYLELDAMLDMLYNSVSVFAWVPFNEGWGQFDTKQAVDRIRSYDSTRLVDAASGWFETGCGDFDSRHVYFRPFRMPHQRDDRILLLSEFGGYSYLEPQHSQAVKLYGYRKYRDRIRLNDAVLDCYERQILPAVQAGLAGCIYTQVSDVEDECNGLLTADRRVLKIDERRMRKMNERCRRSVR